MSKNKKAKNNQANQSTQRLVEAEAKTEAEIK